MGASPTLSTSPISDEVAAQAYKSTFERLRIEFAGDIKSLEIITSLQTTQSLQFRLENLKTECKGTGKKRDATLHWLNRISKGIIHYEKVLDALAQHHAEYVSLVWGAIKFILTGIINYAELLEKFGAAFVEIGDILNDIKQDVHLHVTERILHVYSDMYSHITEFIFRAVRWYKHHGIGRAVHALISPWELKHRDLLTKIRSCANTIDSLSSSESRLEIRQINENVHGLQSDYQVLRDAMRDIQTRLGVNALVMDEIMKTVTVNKLITERVNSHVEEVKPSIYAIEARLQSLIEGGHDQNLAFQKAQAASIRRQFCFPSQLPIRLISSINGWFESPNQPLLIIESSSRARDTAKDLSVNTITQLKKAKLKVLWVFQYQVADSPANCVMNVLKSLIYQIAVREPQTTMRFPRPLFTSDGSASTVQEFRDLLTALFIQFGSSFIIVESQYAKDPEIDKQILESLKQIIHSVSQHSSTQVKVVFLGNGYASTSRRGVDGQRCSTNDEMILRLGPPQPVPPRLRRARRNLAGPQLVRPARIQA
ncbi:hypothetical protein F5Y18DRAFT_123755 [Xylariaceae sp. FL1019]|nr:hypothetical protein F5Y18DRAFT_123755 [Xylariaceae sp. FL1019]